MPAGRSLALLAVLLFWLPTGATAETATLDDTRLVRDFGKIAFGEEFRQVTDPRLTKWTQPLKVFTRIETTMGGADLAFLGRHLRRLSAITGLRIDQVKSEKDANFHIIFTNESKFADLAQNHLGMEFNSRRMANSNCLAYFRSDTQSYTISEAAVLIPVDSAKAQGVLNLCIVEETTQAMGLPNDDNDVNPSIFNDQSALKDLTDHDVMLLRMLYDPRMTPGMRPNEALGVAHEILPGLRRSK